MAEALSGGNTALALLANSAATGAILFVLIAMLGPISGAHLNPAHLKRGFHTTATVAPFAAATAVGLLAGLDRDQLTRALGLAAPS